jgi:hypothetical protein
MLFLLIKRKYIDPSGDGSSEHWFWVPLVNCLRKVPITHYKPASLGGADDILQLEHTGIYKMQMEPELIEGIDVIYTSLQGKSTLSLDETTLQTAYEAFDKIMPLFTTCSNGQIINSSNDISSYDITGWADDANETNVLLFGKLNVYRGLFGNSTSQISSSQIVQSGILSIPKDTEEVKLISINKSIANNTTRYTYSELIGYAIQNKMQISNTYYNPNTLNLHLFVGDIATLKITQQATYFINTKTKNITQHIYPPTVHGYGTTLMPVNGNRIISKIDRFVTSFKKQESNNQLFYDIFYKEQENDDQLGYDVL